MIKSGRRHLVQKSVDHHYGNLQRQHLEISTSLRLLRNQNSLPNYRYTAKVKINLEHEDHTFLKMYLNSKVYNSSV